MNEYFIEVKQEMKISIKKIDGLKENRVSRDCDLKFHIQLSEEKTNKDI